MNAVVFYLIASAIVVSSVLSVTVKNVFHSAIWLSVTLLSIACLYFYLDTPFLAVSQILIYVGGIMVLFVFAIMLTARIGDQSIRQVNHQFFPGCVAAAAFFVIIAQIIISGPWMIITTAPAAVDLKTLGRSLLTQYVLPFEYLSLLLLAALVGAIVIGKVKK
jgi:NADH-quinone oxidoreductase subunit J